MNNDCDRKSTGKRAPDTEGACKGDETTEKRATDTAESTVTRVSATAETCKSTEKRASDTEERAGDDDATKERALDITESTEKRASDTKEASCTEDHDDEKRASSDTDDASEGEYTVIYNDCYKIIESTVKRAALDMDDESTETRASDTKEASCKKDDDDNGASGDCDRNRSKSAKKRAASETNESTETRAADTNNEPCDKKDDDDNNGPSEAKKPYVPGTRVLDEMRLIRAFTKEEEDNETKMSPPRKVVFLIGPPCAGITTLCESLPEDYRVVNARSVIQKLGEGKDGIRCYGTVVLDVDREECETRAAKRALVDDELDMIKTRLDYWEEVTKPLLTGMKNVRFVTDPAKFRETVEKLF